MDSAKQSIFYCIVSKYRKKLLEKVTIYQFFFNNIKKSITSQKQIIKKIDML